MPIAPHKKRSKKKPEGFLKNPFFYFGFFAFALIGSLLFASESLAKLGYSPEGKGAFFNAFFISSNGSENDTPFFGKNKALALETPDLKIIGDDFIYGISTPRVLSTQTLGDIFGEPSYNENNVSNYLVQSGDTVESIAQEFGVSANTILWANDLSKTSELKVGQNLVILPVSGLIHVVKLGDTASEISKIYKADASEVIAFNNLSGDLDIFVGDILIIPGGIMPKKPLPSISLAPLADSFFIFPAEGHITQGLHYYNAVDLANKCGTPVYAAASGTVQRAVGNGGWNLGMGNHITILHSNGVATYYGHLMSLFVKPGQQVNIGDRIALMGGGKGIFGAGASTGCHLHFQVMGAKNPLAKYLRGSAINYK